jgi:Tfp pilus assembly protein PilX
VVLALAILGLTRMRNRGAAEQRATTRALWTATAVNAASSLLRRGPEGHGEATAKAENSGSHRSALLIGGGLALILLGFLFPSGSDDGTSEGDTDAGPGPQDAA